MSREALRIAQQETAAVIHATATAIGGIIPVGEYEWMTVLLEYVNGDETHVDVYPVFLDQAGGIAAPWQEWTAAAGAKTATACTMRLAATGPYSRTFDVRGIQNVVLYEDATGGTPTGTLEVIVVLKGNASR